MVALRSFAGGGSGFRPAAYSANTLWCPEQDGRAGFQGSHRPGVALSSMRAGCNGTQTFGHALGHFAFADECIGAG
jgi:hypothetical protein